MSAAAAADDVAAAAVVEVASAAVVVFSVFLLPEIDSASAFLLCPDLHFLRVSRGSLNLGPASQTSECASVELRKERKIWDAKCVQNYTMT